MIHNPSGRLSRALFAPLTPSIGLTANTEEPPLKSLKSKFVLCVLGVTMIIPTVVFGCSTAIFTDQLGDGVTYRCLLVAESTNYCYYDCTPVE